MFVNLNDIYFEFFQGRAIFFSNISWPSVSGDVLSDGRSLMFKHVTSKEQSEMKNHTFPFVSTT